MSEELPDLLSYFLNTENIISLADVLCDALPGPDLFGIHR